MQQHRRVNKLGQEIRSRGADTRASLLKAAQRLLKTQSPLTLSVHAIARQAGSSPATFYVYFADVKDVLFALCETTREDTASILQTLDGPWRAEELVQHIKAFVAAYYAFWDKHRRVLSVRNLEADLGDARFADERVRTGAPIVDALALRIREARGLRKLSYEDAWAEALVVCAGMEQMFSYSTDTYRRSPIKLDHVMRAEIELISKLVDTASARPKKTARRSRR